MLHVCAHMGSMYGYRAHNHSTVCSIAQVTHDKLHEMCMFHATIKHGTHQHIMELLKVI